MDLKPRGKVPVFLFLILVLWGGWLVWSWIRSAPVTSRVPLPVGPVLTAEKPVGEIVDGMIIEQDLALPEGMVARSFSVGVWMATYERKNRGRVAISLEQGGEKKRKVFHSKKLLDNTPVFVDVPAGFFEEGTLRLRITGIGGKPGLAPTAWTDPSGDGNGYYHVNGHRVEGSLCYFFAKSEEVQPVTLGKRFLGNKVFFWSGFAVFTILCIGLLKRIKEVAREGTIDGNSWLDSPRLLAAVLGMFYLKVLLLALFMIPRWEIPDETGHYSYIEDLSQGRGLPVIGESMVARFPHDDLGTDKFAGPNWIAQHPPLYYLVMTPVFKVAQVLGLEVVNRFYLLRAVSALFGVGALAMLYYCVLALGGRPFFGTLVAGLAGAIPMVTNLAAGVNHDLFLCFLSIGGCYFWIRFYKGGGVVCLWTACALFGLAAFTKYTGIAVAFFWFSGVALSYRAAWKDWLKNLTVGGLILAGPTVAWVVRNLVVYGEALPVFDKVRELVNPEMTYFSFLKAYEVWETLFRNGLCLIGWLGRVEDDVATFMFLPPLLSWPYSLGLLLLGGLGLALILWEYPDKNRVVWFLAALVGLLVLPFMRTQFSSPNWLFQYGVLFLSAVIVLRLVLNVIFEYKRATPERYAASVAHLSLIGFGIMVTYTMYQFTMISGYLRAAHGRYFLPLAGFMLVGFAWPVIRVLADWPRLLLCILVSAQVLEAVLWLFFVPSFYLR